MYNRSTSCWHIWIRHPLIEWPELINANCIITFPPRWLEWWAELSCWVQCSISSVFSHIDAVSDHKVWSVVWANCIALVNQPLASLHLHYWLVVLQSFGIHAVKPLLMAPLKKGQLWYNGQVPNEQFVYKQPSHKGHPLDHNYYKGQPKGVPAL